MQNQLSSWKYLTVQSCDLYTCLKWKCYVMSMLDWRHVWLRSVQSLRVSGHWICCRLNSPLSTALEMFYGWSQVSWWEKFVSLYMRAFLDREHAYFSFLPCSMISRNFRLRPVEIFDCRCLDRKTDGTQERFIEGGLHQGWRWPCDSGTFGWHRWFELALKIPRSEIWH